MGVQVGGSRKAWLRENGLPSDLAQLLDRDILAVDRSQGALIVAEVEGDSSGQPEQKVYKAIGQLVFTLGRWRQLGIRATLKARFVLAVSTGLVSQAAAAAVLEDLGVSSVELTASAVKPIFGDTRF
jgi:hypothetical protein